MSQPATCSDEPHEGGAGATGGRPERAATLRTLGRHQVGSAVSSAVDFLTMIGCVQALRLSPVAGTALGASLGAATNFTLGRLWVFRQQSGGPAPQALRYVLVSAASAGWNSLGEHLMHDLAHVQYVLARAIVAVGVSLLWNFPLQRRFVFREGSGR